MIEIVFNSCVFGLYQDRSYFGRGLLVLALVSIFVLPVASQSVPDIPHRVYGDITDGGEGVKNLDVEFRESSSNVVASGLTDSSGFYDVRIMEENISSSKDFIYLFVEGKNTSKHINFSSGESEELSYSGDFLQELIAGFSYSTDGLDVEVNASESLGSPITYRWDWTGDGSFESIGETASNTYGSEGDYNVVLQVEDSSGDTDNISKAVTVSEDSDSSGGGGSSGGSGGNTGGSSGGFGSLPPEENENEEEEPERKLLSVNMDDSERETVELGQLKEGQEVEVSVLGDDKLTGFSFISGENSSSASLELESLDNSPSDVPALDRGPVYGYMGLEFSGLEEFSNGVIGFKVNKNWLSSMDRGQQEVLFERFEEGKWNNVQSSTVSDDFNSHIFEANVDDVGSFAVALPEEEEQGVQEASLQVTSFQVEESNSSSGGVTAKAVVSNEGNVRGSKSFYVMSGDERVEEITVSLEPGEETEVSRSLRLGSGIHTISLDGRSTEVTIPEESSNLLIYGVAGVVLALVGLFIIIYVKESREARKLDEKIERIRRGERSAESQLDKLERDLIKLERKLRGTQNRNNRS